jgi:hypothetical protein
VQIFAAPAVDGVEVLEHAPSLPPRLVNGKRETKNLPAAGNFLSRLRGFCIFSGFPLNPGRWLPINEQKESQPP